MLVERYHHRTDVDIPNLMLHATIHAIVEDQLAEGYGAARDAFERVRAQGLGRHDAIHAVGSVVAEHVLHLMRDGASEGDPNAAYDRALRELSADSWRELAE